MKKYVDPINKAAFKKYFTGAMKHGENIAIAFPEPVADDPAYIYIINGFIAVKLPACFWPEYAQPAFMRECPKPGESVCISGRMDKPAGEWLKFWNDLINPATEPATVTPYTRIVTGTLAVRIFSLCKTPLTIDEKYLNMFDWQSFKFTGSKNISPVHAENSFCEVVFLPVRSDPTSADQAIIDGMPE